MTSQCLIAGFKSTPYWWDHSRCSPKLVDFPEGKVDVVVVGGGFSGLFTALALARGGLSVVVLEAARIAEHASGRNFGAIGRTIRLSFSQLAARDGLETATRVYEEAKEWVEFTAGFIEREGIDCGFYRNGRVVAAHSPGAFDSMARELEFTKAHLSVETRMVPITAQREELGSDVYHGCAVLDDVGHLDPGRYLHGVLERLEQAGGRIFEQTRVVGIDARQGGFSVSTQSGRRIESREVVLATNAETGVDNPLFRWFHRRVIPIEVYSAVSTPLEPGRLGDLIPKRRTVLETRRLYMALRPVEPENRILIVARHMRPYASLERAAEDAKADLVVRYPSLRDVQFSHIWRGRFAVTFDWLPHLGTRDGIHYLMGLNGAGVPATGYLGHKLAQRILGRPNQETVFADREFPTHRGYTGNAWFLPPMAGWMRFLDRREAGLKR